MQCFIQSESGVEKISYGSMAEKQTWI